MSLYSLPPEDPYSGLAASTVTGNLIDLRFTDLVTLSFATIGGSFSTTTIQLSNGPGSNRVGDSPAALGFSTWTVLGNVALVSGITLASIPAGYNWMQFQRSTSSASILVNRTHWR